MSQQVFVVVGSGGEHSTLQSQKANGHGADNSYEFEVFVVADELEEAVERADLQLDAEGWSGITWEKVGVLEPSAVTEEVEEAYEDALSGKVVVVVYALSREDLAN